MKKTLLLICSCVFCFALGHASSYTPSYYYSLGKKCELSRIESKLAFQKNSNIDREEFLQTLPLRSTNHDIEWRGNDICIIEYNDTLEVSQFKRDLLFRGLDSIIVWPVYTINYYTEAILFREILIKPKSFVNIDTLVTRYGLTLKNDKGNYLVYSVPKDSDVVFIANQIYETGTCEFSYPHFGVRFQSFSYTPNDTYFSYQITCHNTGQTLPNGHSGSADADIDAPEAWSITKGSPDVIVAVFDEGVTSNHPDLPNSRQIRLNGSNFGSGNSNDPSPTGDSNHGNACAGVIAATMDNNEGIAGIAPNCKIMPLRWDGGSSDTEMADGIYFAVNNGANIISCSWGAVNPSYTSDAIYNAIYTAIEQNVIVIFAAGNTANQIAGNNGYVCFPANADIANLITVGASDRYDMQANYSPSGSLIDFVAPSHRAYSDQISGETFEMYSIDIPGPSGYNPIPSGMDGLVAGTTIPSSGTNYLAYTGCFGGTSHSCPVVAGVVALMISVNPYLSNAEVYDILKETSEKVGGYTYINGKCDEMGYGRVNANKAVQKAKSRYIQGPETMCDTAKYYLIHPSQSGETVSWSVENGDMIGPYYYSIIGDDDQDTVLVKCEYIYSRFGYDSVTVPTLDHRQYLSVTISTNDTSETYTKTLHGASNKNPNISASNSSMLWPINTQRTFTITNCSLIADSLLHWRVQTTFSRPQPITLTGHFYGQTLTYTPQTPPGGKISAIRIFASNEKPSICGEAYSDTLLFIVPRNTALLTNQFEQDLLNVYITEDSEESSHELLQLDENSNYTLELWHNIYGRMCEQTVHTPNIQMNTSELSQGIYVLILKENGNIVAETKVQIN